MPEIIVYHGTQHAFSRPDPSCFRTGEGASSYGVGFYVAAYPDMVYDHLRERNGGRPVTNENFNGVIYEIDIEIPDERVLTRSDTFDSNDLQRFINSAENTGEVELAQDLRNLQSAMASDGSYEFATRIVTSAYDNGTQRVSIKNGEISFNHLEHFIDKTAGQNVTSNVITNAGYDAIYSGKMGPSYEMYTILNVDVVKGETRIFETFGDGPLRNNSSVERQFGSETLANPSSHAQPHTSRALIKLNL